MTNDERNAVIEECAKCVPNNWLDPLLTGPKKVVPADRSANVVEPLLTALGERIRALKAT